MEAQMDGGFDQKRLMIPSIIVFALVVVLSTGIYLRGRKKPSGGGSDSVKKAAAAAPAAAGAVKKGDKANGKDEKAPVPVSIEAIRSAAVSSYISSTANLVAENDVKVIAEAEGRVEQLLVEEGTTVGKGQPLATLVRDDAEIALRKAEVRTKNAQVSYTRTKEMLSTGLVSQGDFDKIKMEKDVAEQELAEAKWRMGKTTIRAPFSGRVTERMIREGQHVKPGDTLFAVTDYDPLIALIYLPEKDVMPLNVGRDVLISLKAAEDVQFHGRIRQISPVVDTATGTIKVTVEAVSPPSAVRPGSFVTIDIIRETHPKATLIPREAVIRELRDAHVFIAKGTSAEKRVVSLGIEEGDFVEALSGVKPGENVIVAGQGGLRDGSVIKVLPANQKG